MNIIKSLRVMTFTLLAAGLLAAYGGINSARSNSSASNVLTLNGFANLSAPTGLNYSADASTVTRSPSSTSVSITWLSGSTGSTQLWYSDSGAGTEQKISFTTSPDGGIHTFNVGTWPLHTACNVGGPETNPPCSAWGITFNRAAGTITFASTPVFLVVIGAGTSGLSGTLSGSLSFAPF